jgi:hypothetical protein
MDTTPQKMWSTRNPPCPSGGIVDQAERVCVHDRPPSDATGSSLLIGGQFRGRSPTPRTDDEYSGDGDRETHQDDEQRSGHRGSGGGATAGPRARGRGLGCLDRSIFRRREFIDDRRDRREQGPCAVPSVARVPLVRTPTDHLESRFVRARRHLARTEGCVASSSS